MKHSLILLSLSLLLLFQNSCDNSTSSKQTIFKQCSTLGDESIAYARANYVKLFNAINPEKFSSSYQKVKDFDNVSHRNIINTYDVAVRKLKKDPASTRLIQSCLSLAQFSKNFVDQTYPRAITFKEESKLDPLSDEFFLEINKIVKFDHTIGHYDKSFISFKQRVEDYERIKEKYKATFKSDLELTD